MLTPLKSKHFPYSTRIKMLPLVSHEANLFKLCPFPDSPAILHYMYKKYSQSVQPFDHISQAFELLTPNHPPPPNAAVGYRGANCFSLRPFPDESTDVYQIWCHSVHPFGSFPRLKCMTPKTPRNAPCGIEGRIVFSYVHSQMNPQTCTEFCANRSISLAAFADLNL